MINMEQFSPEKEPELFETVLLFNELYINKPDDTGSFTYYELWKETGQKVPLSHWKDFKLDTRVRKWYSTELDLMLDSNLQKIAHKAGFDKSTATQQTLTALLNRKETKSLEENKVYMIYGFIPVTSIEENLENVKIITTIPKAISDAVIIREGDHKSEK